VPLRLAGAGWDAIESLGALAVGPISSREQFANAIDEAAVLVHVWPTDSAHPIDACGRPVVRPATTRGAFLHDARTAITGRGVVPRPAGPALSAELLAELLEN
jgi:hypothetical protein